MRDLGAWLALAMAIPLVIAPPSMRHRQADTTPPTVTTRTPPAGATGISTLIAVGAIFSEPIQEATLVMQLRNSANQLVGGTQTYAATTRTATFTPAAALAGSQTYTMQVSGARDLAGNVMATSTWSFTTATSGFQDLVLPQTGLTEPTVMQFAADGRLFVAEKSGRVLVFDSLTDTTATVAVDLRANVYNFWDRGLLGMALHPNFPAVPYLYVLYTYDALPGGSAPRWNDDCPTPPGPTTNGCVATGRLARYNLGNPALWPLGVGSEEPLVTDWFQQFPSHSMGSIVFGADGALYVSGGEGASYNYADIGQTTSSPASSDPNNQGGALRSQDLQTSGDPVGLSGSVIRVDPDTGLALPTNPRASDTDANGRRIVAYGLRNPFRMTVRPGTNEIWIGDVGFDKTEEIDRITDGSDAVVENFGWPCYEGDPAQQAFATFGTSICQALYNQPALVTRPLHSWDHNEQVVPGEACPNGGSAISGLAFYPATAVGYPAAYRGALFFADYARNCIWAMRPGTSGTPDPTRIDTIKSGAASPVQLVSGPGGDIFYVGLADNRLHRISYSGGNLPPTAVIQTSSTAGPLPLSVDFDAFGSTDPEGQVLTYSWDLNGDGTFGDATTVTATRTFTTASAVTIRLRVTDSLGLSSTAARVIWPGNSAPVAAITAPAASLTWKVGDAITFAGGATDAEEGALPPSTLAWTLIIHHCPSTCHTHTAQTFAGAGGSFAAPDHEYPSHLELRLTATDTGGLQSTTSVLLFPKSVTLTLLSNPSAMQLSANANAGLTPFTQDVIVGSNASLGAPSPQTIAGQTYVFSAWSDGGAQVHNITAPATPTALVATYTAATAVPGLVAAFGMNEGSGTVTADGTGKGHAGTIAGAAWTTTGKFGGALSFNGTSSRVSVADAADLRLTTGMTIEAWVNPAVLSGWRTVLVKEGPSVIPYGLYAYDNAPRPAGYINLGASDMTALGTTSIPVNSWSHLALTYDGATERLFVNGSQVGSRAATGSLRSTTNQLSIGSNLMWGEYYSGLIDEVRVYSRALTAPEILADMATPIGAPAPPPGDTTSPTASLTAPAAGLVRGTVTVTASASDNSGAVAAVQFRLDGTALGSPDTSAPFSLSWNTTGVTGAHVLTAVASDAAGNQGTSAPVTVTVDNTPPAVAVTSPPAGAVSGTVTVSAQATDASGIASVQFLLDGTNLGAADTAAPFGVTWNTAGAAPGTHALAAIAVDAAGNTATSAAVTVTTPAAPDTTPPSVSVTSPAAAAQLSGTVTISASASDNVGVSRVQFRIDGVDFGASDTAAPYSIAWNTTTAANGAHTVAAVAFDAANNQAASTTVAVTVANGWIPPAGLVAAYTFNAGSGTTAADLSGGNNTGTLVGGPAWTTQGRFGGAITFDGVNDLVSVADAAALDLTTAMTIEAWVRPTTLSGWRTVAMKSAAAGMAYALFAHDNVPPRPAGYINQGASDISAPGTVALPLNTWTHLAVTYDNATLRLYLNGVQVGSRAVTGAIRTSTGTLTIGGNTVWGEWFAGAIDEVRLYNRALTPAEIQAGMTQTIGG